jgi:hypothetical protein
MRGVTDEPASIIVAYLSMLIEFFHMGNFAFNPLTTFAFYPYPKVSVDEV